MCSGSDKYLNVERIYLKHEDAIHEFKSYTSPFVCRTCPPGTTCAAYDGNNEEPINLANFSKFEKQYKYESTYFYGQGYSMDLISIEIRIINSYSFTILISRESPFSEMPLDFHELISPNQLTPKYIHEKILEKLVTSVKNVQPLQKILELKRDDDNPPSQGTKYPPVGIY